MYGEYFADILEGNELSDRESLVSECLFQTGVDDRKQRVDSGPDDDEIQEWPQEPEAVTQSEPLVVDSTWYTSTDRITIEAQAQQPIESNIGCKQVDTSTVRACQLPAPEVTKDIVQEGPSPIDVMQSMIVIGDSNVCRLITYTKQW